jgi:hypothetical protein
VAYSQLTGDKITLLSDGFAQQQNLFISSTLQPDAAVLNAYEVTEIFAKKKFSDGEIMKERLEAQQMLQFLTKKKTNT